MTRAGFTRLRITLLHRSLQYWIGRLVYPSAISGLVLLQYYSKVSKSQKQFFLKLHCPKKRTKYLAECCLIFVRFWGQCF